MNSNIRHLLEDATANRTRNFIDLGCGDGSICFWLAEQGISVIGVDRALPFPPGVPISISDVGPGSVILLNADVCELHIDDSFHTIICFGLLHNLGGFESVNDLLNKIAAWSTLDGRILLSWLLDVNPTTPEHVHAYFPPADVVEEILNHCGFQMIRSWTTPLEHSHRGGPIHTHQAIYSSWSRRDH